MARNQVLFAELPQSLEFAFLSLLLVVGLVIVLMVAALFRFWVRALVSGARVSYAELLALWLRKVPAGLIVDNRINAIRSGLEIGIDQLSAHFLAGGDVEMVVRALIMAQKAGIKLDFDQACAIDLATQVTGKTVVEAVEASVNPKVIDCPKPTAGKTTIDGATKDGIVVKAKARVTIRTHLDRFIGGAAEETIIARVGEGILDLIGTADSHKEVLEHPDSISKKLLGKALDSNTAFEILAIDITLGQSV
jgi:uncharacterized protein YqfA (UPF0365 family)